VAEHEAVPVVAPATNWHGEIVNKPKVPASLVKSTSPVGVKRVLDPEESVTVAVQVADDPVLTDAGWHDTVVVVACTVMGIVTMLLVLWLWLLSPL